MTLRPGSIGCQNDITEWMRPNRWTLVKMHFNTTSTTGNSWEMWLRPYGGTWLKVAEWIGGVTPGFTWDIPAGSVGGHRVLRMPTTVDHDYRILDGRFRHGDNGVGLAGWTEPPEPNPIPASGSADKRQGYQDGRGLFGSCPGFSEPFVL